MDRELPRLRPCGVFLPLKQGLHTPVIHVPAFVGESGMPVGLSVVAGRFLDRYLLDITTKLSKVLMAEGELNDVEASSKSRI